MVSDYPDLSDDELVGRVMLNLRSERRVSIKNEIERSETPVNTYVNSNLIRVMPHDISESGQSDFITDDNATLPASSEVGDIFSPRPSLSQDSGVVCADFSADFGKIETSSLKNEPADLVSRESFQKNFEMTTLKRTDLDQSPSKETFMESPVFESGNAWTQKGEFYFKGFSTDRLSIKEPERTSANHSVDKYRPNSAMAADKKAFFLLASLMTNTWIALLICLIVGVILPVGLAKIMYDVGLPSVDRRVDSFRINSHPASEKRFVLEELFRRRQYYQYYYFYYRQRRQSAEYFKDNSTSDTSGSNRSRRDLNPEDFTSDIEDGFQRERRSSTNKKKRFLSEKVYYYYVTKNGKGNVFTEKHLELIHNFENEMALTQGFRDHCLHGYTHLFSYYTSHINRCFPLFSVNGFFYPSPYELGKIEGRRRLSYEGFAFDGFGSKITNFEDSYDLMKSRDDFYSYFDSTFDVNVRESTFIKSTWYVGRSSRYGSAQLKDSENAYILGQEDLIQKYEKNSDFKVYYYAENLMEYMLGLIINSDIQKTVISLLIIGIFVFFFTGGSPWLTFWTIVILLGSIVDNIFLYYIVFGIDKLGMLNAASGIILVSIGVDDVLVFINIFRSKSRQMNTREKVASTLHGAAISTFLTSFTTSLAFSANIISPVPAVKSFGLFMATLVLVCWALVVILMPPVLFIWERHILGTKAVIYKKLDKIKEKRKERRTNPETSSEDGKKCQICSISKVFQIDYHSKLVQVLNKFTHVVIRFRWVLMAVWLALMVLSIYGVTNLEADQNIPKIFSKTNRLEEAMKLRQKNAYSPDQACYKCHPIRMRSKDFDKKHWNTTTAEVRFIADWYKYYNRGVSFDKFGKDGRYYYGENVDPKRQSEDPVKPLSSTAPLVAVVLGIWDYSVKTNAFYSSKPEVSITEDENFLDDVEAYEEDLNVLEATEIALEIGDKVRAMCEMCRMIAENSELVNERRAQCIPPIKELMDAKTTEDQKLLIDVYEQTFESFEECQGLPDTRIISGDLAKGTIGYLNGKLPGYFIFVFESTMKEEDSAWKVRNHFVKWDEFMDQVASQFSVESGLTRPIFASDRFDAAFMELAAQIGAFYSMVLGMSSILIVLAFFTGYLEYLVTILLTVVSCVLVLFGSFFYFNLKLGAVEMVVGSILVGSSVDYIFHLVESYSIYARDNRHDFKSGTAASEMRQANCVRAMRRIGLSIISSSLTTVMGCLPLTVADLNPLRMFGVLIMISSISALILTLLFGLPLLAIIAPVKAKVSIQRRSLLLFCTAAIFTILVLIAYTITVAQGVKIVGPNGL